MRALGMTSGADRMLKLVWFGLVDLVHLVSLVQPYKQDKPNNGLLALVNFFSVLLKTQQARRQFLSDRLQARRSCWPTTYPRGCAVV